MIRTEWWKMSVIEMLLHLEIWFPRQPSNVSIRRKCVQHFSFLHAWNHLPSPLSLSLTHSFSIYLSLYLSIYLSIVHFLIKLIFCYFKYFCFLFLCTYILWYPVLVCKTENLVELSCCSCYLLLSGGSQSCVKNVLGIAAQHASFETAVLWKMPTNSISNLDKTVRHFL